ncbi:Fic family protein [Acetobacterium tundrae]|uniref:Filamentation induced by cAMP protein Fic-like C-terminal domain-containing protein n=1 Tax=Acetobacterium tundrae TaxID=132932 RepID=A0ABR6WPW9_9FIRM|nr:hypothetical protein [Acetobacterium tundrae]MBC3798540.1 hypothetical protein [Acetobacterium tundrae]
MFQNDYSIDQATPQAEVKEEQARMREILEFCRIPKSRQEIKDPKDFRNRILNPLIKGGLLKLILLDKPTSPNQKYYY